MLSALSNAQPLSTTELDRLREIVADYDHDQLVFSSGYLLGLANAPEARVDRASVAAPAAAPGGDASERWTVFYATETGNSKSLAEALSARANAAGVATNLEDLSRFKPHRLAKTRRAVFIVATHGVGDPPEGSEPFFDYWLADGAPRLEQLEFSVLSLGDSSYADFCEIGRTLDERLAALGGRRIAERVDCDLDFDDAASGWSQTVVDKAVSLSQPTRPSSNQTSSNQATIVSRAVLRAVQPTPATSPASRSRPFAAKVLTDQRITGHGSTKDVRHVELDLDGSGLDYLPGDSLGVVPTNPAEVVEDVLAVTGIDESAEVRLRDQSISAAEALREHLEITALSRPLLNRLAAEHPRLAQMLDDRDALPGFLATHQVVDVLAAYPVAWQAQTLADSLRRLPPRLYSIASSPAANPDEAHLTVAVVRYEAHGRPHWGTASNFLASGPDTVPVFVEPNERFRLPADPDVPVVMIGAGTGIAPYRAFVEHRRELGHRGNNWLIFGDRNFDSDFLYQLEWLRFRKQGFLSRIDAAFSRDGRAGSGAKTYVQHRIAEQSRRLYDWIERGAHVYVCGDADRMAVDVQAALLDVLRSEGGLTDDGASERLAELRASGRYQRDVY